MKKPFHIGHAFWLAFVASAVGVVTTTFYGLDAFWIFGAGFSPLVLYHCVLSYHMRSTSVPNATVDTVYYLGFLVTVITLATTVIKIGLSGTQALMVGDQFKRIAVIFGLGLTATGYALFARIQLMMQSERIEAEDLVDKVDRYALEAERVLETLRKSGVEFEAFAAVLRDSAVRANEESSRSAQTSVLSIATIARAELQTSFSDLRREVMEFGVELRKLVPKTEVDSLTETVGVLGSTLRKFGGRIENLVSKTEEIEPVLEEFGAALGGVIPLIVKVGAGANKIGDFGIPLADVRATTAALGTELRQLGTDAGLARMTLAQLNVQVGSSATELTDALKLHKAAAGQFAQASKRATDVMSAGFEARERLSIQEDAAATAMGRLSVQADEQLERLMRGSDGLPAVLDRALKRFESGVDELSEKADLVHGNPRRRGISMEALSGRAVADAASAGES